jgi:hypothetical protein
MLELFRIIRLQPFRKQVADFERKTQQNITSFACAHDAGACEDRLDLGVVKRRDDRCNHHCGGDFGRCKLPHRLEPAKRAACAIESCYRYGNFGETLLGHWREEIEVAQDKCRFGDVPTG